MAVITIRGMKFYAHHGCFEQERAIGTHFKVDLALHTDTTRAEETDDINHTVNYLDVYQVVKKEFQNPSHLLEHVAHRVGEAVLTSFRQVEKVEIEVFKLNPPLGGQMDSVSVMLTLSK